MKILITGGAGFIGRCLAKKCVENGDEVLIYDNLSFGRPNNIAEFADKVTFVEGDILDQPLLVKTFLDFRPQLVYHLAALHFIPFCNDNPLTALRINADGTAGVFEAASAAGAVKIVVASTGAIYRSTEFPLEEEVEVASPPDIYGLSKLLAEQICSYYSKAKNIECIMARLFNNYGPYETNPHLIPHIIESLRDNDFKVKLGNVSTKRDYVNTDDTANGLLRLGATPVPGGFDIVNLGTGKEYTALEILQEMERICGRKIELEIDPSRLRPVDKPNQIAGTTKAAEKYGWRAQVSLEDGLRALLKHENLI